MWLWVLAFCIVVVLFTYAVSWIDRRIDHSYEVVEWWIEHGDYVVHLRSGCTFRGRSTVWHYYDDGTRAGTLIERRLSNIATRIKWGREDKKRIEKP